MNTPSPTPDSAADERASYWAARLDGSVLSAADQIALEAWLAEKPAHRSLLSTYCQFSADLEQLLPSLAAAGAIDQPGEIAPRARGWNLPWVAGVALGAAAVVATLLWLGRPRTEFASMATTVAQRQTLTLADGSRAELNAQTSLQIEMGPTERRVRLASGEAYFTVTKDKARPFIVETPAGAVRVTGTVFDVRAETTTALEVLVVEGSVQVRPAESAGHPVQPTLLAPREKLSAGPDGVTVRTLSPKVVDDELAWRNGQVVFAGVPLSEALARFARYHGRGLVAAPEVAHLAVGGRYSLDDLDGFLAALEAFLPVRVSRNLSGTVLVGPAENSRAVSPDRGNP